MKEYNEIFRIHKAYVCGIADQGMSRREDDDGFIDQDDLRLCIELSAGHVFMLTGRMRFYFYDDYLIIEDLIEVKDN